MPLPKARRKAGKKARQKVVGKVMSKLKDEKPRMKKSQRIAIALSQAGLSKKGKKKR